MLGERGFRGEHKAIGKFGLRPRKKRPLGSGSSIVSAGVSDDKAPSTPFSRKKGLCAEEYTYKIGESGASTVHTLYRIIWPGAVNGEGLLAASIISDGY